MTSQIVAVTQAVAHGATGALGFDTFQLFPRRRLLLRNADVVRIGDRAFDLLTILASRAGEIVSHAELIRTVWPNRVVVDSNLKTQIVALQKVLGLAPDGGRYIKNVAMRGYVFVAEVHHLPWSGIGLSGMDETTAALQVRH